LDIKHRPAKPEECQILSIQPGDQVIQVQRVMRAKDRAVAYLIDTLPTDILTAEELKTGFTGSVLDFMLRRGEPRLQISHTEINAATATSSVARAMGIQRGAVLLHFTAMLYAQNGRVIDYSTSYFLPGYFRFHVVRRVG
jgi:GntR family transcriptional regulator